MTSIDFYTLDYYIFNFIPLQLIIKSYNKIAYFYEII